MNKYRKAIKNYSTKARIDLMITDIQSILLGFGATGIGFEYDGEGKISSIGFKVEINDITQTVTVPFLWKETAQVLEKQGFYKNEDHAYRVSIANVRDWLDAQLALESTKMVKFEQVFLPYIVTNNGQTVFERINDLPLLGEPRE